MLEKMMKMLEELITLVRELSSRTGSENANFPQEYAEEMAKELCPPSKPKQVVLTYNRTVEAGCCHGRITGDARLQNVGFIELPWKDNQRAISAIPLGRYVVKPHSGSRFRNHWRLWQENGKDVSGRSAIVLHEGNFINWRNTTTGQLQTDSDGCPLFVTRVEAHNATGGWGSASVAAQNRFRDFFNSLAKDEDLLIVFQ